MSKELIAATVQELEGWPDVTMTEDNSAKHGKIVLHYKDQLRFVVFASTPSDRRALANHISVVRKELRGMGATKHYTQKEIQPKPIAVAMELAIIKEELPVKQGDKIEAIFAAIGELRYGEMMVLSNLLSDVATDAGLRRSRPNDWATMLHTIVDSGNTKAVIAE